MTTFINSITLPSSPAIIIPGTSTTKELVINYKHLSSITGQLQTLIYNPTSPLYDALKPSEGNSTGLKQSAIAISLPNSLEFVAAFLAITTSGRIAAPLNPAYKSSELDFYLQDLDAKAIIVPRGTATTQKGAELCKSAKSNKVILVEVWYSDSRERVEYELFHYSDLKPFHSSVNSPVFQNFAELLPGHCEPEDVALVIHTSGTTGRPKAVPLTHRNITQSMQNITQNFRLNSNDRTLLVMPLFHVHGLIGALLSTLRTGGAAIIPPKFSASVFWDQFLQYSATWYSAVPTIHVILLNTAKPPAAATERLKFIRSCSSALAPETFRKLESVFKAPVVESYGSSESSHCMTSNLLPPGARIPGTVGAGLNVDVKIIDDDCNFLTKPGAIGEVVVKGANVMHGYINNAKANRESFTDGYFRTGDQGFVGENGFLTLTGRIKELINRGGEKISPIELDGVMLEHPGIEEAVSFGVSDAKYGQVVNAAVVLRKGASLDQAQLQEWLKDKLSAFKIPSKIFFADKLPKTATGKIQRRILAEVFTKNEPKL